MANVRDFLDYVAMHAADAPEDILLFNIQESVTDFLIDTKLATNYYRINLDSKVNDYVLDIPDCHILLSFKRVLIGNRCEETVDWEELKPTIKPERYGYYADVDNEGEPAIWIGQPDDNSGVEVEYTYTTGRGPCEVPNFVLDKYARVIQYYALSRIHSVMGQEWSNPQLAVNYSQQYEREIAKIKRATRSMRGGGKLISKPFIGRGHGFGYGGFFR